MYFCSHFYFIFEIIKGARSRQFFIFASQLHETFLTCRVLHIHVALTDNKQTDFSKCFTIFGKKILGRRLYQLDEMFSSLNDQDRPRQEKDGIVVDF